MKLRYLLPVAALAIGSLLTSCVKDLEVENINPQQVPDLNVDYLFNKMYANLVLTGQTGAAGSQDLDDIDEGTSNLLRQLWNANELTTEEAHCWWNDAGIPEFDHNSWSDTHPMMKALYYRLIFGVTLANFYMENATGDDAEMQQRLAEARFLRALHYFYLMDLYGNPPFMTKMLNPGEKAPQIQRADLFKFIESELKDIIGEGSGSEKLAAPRTVQYGRADQAAGYLLLARMYLNAQVYTGTPRWNDAKTYAEKAIGTSYKLCTTPSPNGWSAYQLLFMGDNDTNGAQDEIILPALHDGEDTRTYGGSLYLMAALCSESMKSANLFGVGSITGYGTAEAWDRGIRSRKQFVQVFFPFASVDADIPQGNIKSVVAKAGDDRALFYTKGQTLSLEKEGDKEKGFLYLKFNNLHSDGTTAHDAGGHFVDTDFPLLRLAEAYLISAEADARMNGGTCTAAGVARIKALHSRANLSASNPYNTQTSYGLDDIIKEWSREFGFEGQRRMHLIRFGMFGGQSKYRWEWMGGAKNGTPFDVHFNIFPIPSSDLNANANLKQNPGY